MAERFLINLDEFDEIIAEMSRFDADAESLCGEVDQLVGRLHVTWAGEGARAAHANYAAAVQANVGMWPA